MSETERVLDPWRHMIDQTERVASLTHGVLDRGNRVAASVTDNAVVRDRFGPSVSHKKMFQGGSGGKGGFLGDVGSVVRDAVGAAKGVAGDVDATVRDARRPIVGAGDDILRSHEFTEADRRALFG